MQTKTMTPVTSRNKWKKTVYLLVISAVLLVLGLAAMFTLGTSSLRYDAAYDSGADLSAYFFAPLAEGERMSERQLMDYLQELVDKMKVVRGHAEK